MMVTSLLALHTEINLLRTRMLSLAREYGLSHPEVVACSSELDHLIFQFQQLHLMHAHGPSLLGVSPSFPAALSDVLSSNCNIS